MKSRVWKRKKLGELTTYIARGITPKYTEDDGIIVLNQKCIRDFNVNIEQSRMHNAEMKKIMEEKYLRTYDILINSTGVGTAGRIAQWMVESINATVDSHVTIVRPNPQIIDPLFLGYAIKEQQGFIESFAEGSTGQTEISRMRLADEVMIVYPEDKNIQSKISEVLKNIDDKINLNAKLNDNLIELMQLYFNENIIDVEHDDWSESNLDEIASYLNGLAMQKFRPKGGDYLPVIKIREMRGGFSENTDKADVNIPNQYIIEDGDILFSWSGTLDIAIWCNGRGGLNQHIFKVTSEKYPKWFYYLWTCYHLQHFKMIAATKATTMGHIRREELKKAIVYIPDTELMKNLNSLMTPLVDEYIEKAIENRKLSELRDTLLPKLMSGEIDLDNFEINI